ncbi:MAG: site-specific integrase [Nostoc sp. LLA-1]|nr:site-specific integrase [Cyanocohniella sp. LLY]
MFSKTSKGRGYKGSVSIISSNSRLQLRFHYGGKRHYLSTGLLDTLANWKLAEYKAAEIEKDILYERFDESLEKYKPRSSLSTVTPVTPIHKSKPHLDELWNKYSEFKKPQVSPSTYAKDFTKHRNHIAKLPTRSLDEASAIRDYLLAKLTPDAAKRCLTQLKACCNWAMEEGLIDANPFAAMKIKAPKGATEEQDINPFSKEERDLIIRTFASDRYYSHYTNYVRFLFFTGCRPSEAIALKWKHITNSVVQFRESVVVSEDGLVMKEGLKTQRKRDFPINSELLEILDEISPEEPVPEALIFTSPKGKFIDHHNFSNRAWKAILAKCCIPYRKSYQTRHTFISFCVESHINSTAIGRWTGTSAKMIDNHYGATNFTNLRPPNLS